MSRRFTKNDGTDLMHILEIVTDMTIRASYTISAKTGYGIRKMKTLVAQQNTIKSLKKPVKLLAHGNIPNQILPQKEVFNCPTGRLSIGRPVISRLIDD